MEKRLQIFRRIHFMALGIGFASIILPAAFWKWIPDTIPMHYNGVGVVDNWEDKSSLLLLFFVILLMMGMMSIIEYYIRTSGLSKNASNSEKENLKTVYPMIVVLNLILQLTFAYIVFCSVMCRELGIWFLPVVLISTFAPIIWLIVKSCKQGGSVSKEQKRIYAEREKGGMEEGVTYRTKIDLWIGVLLGGAVLMELWLAIKMLLQGKQDWFMIGTTVFVTVLIVPMFFIRYTLYSDYILVDAVIFGKERIPYKSITKIQKTCNPLSSTAMSIRRIQIDYTLDGVHKMTMISPVRRDEFIEEVEKRRKFL